MKRFLGLFLLAVSVAFLCAQRCQHEPDARDFPFDHDSAKRWVKTLAVGPHPFGSSEQKDRKEKLLSFLKTLPAAVYEQDFSAATPHPLLLKNPDAPSPLSIEKQGTNIIFIPAIADRIKPCIVLLGSHYDTKDVEGIQYLGANDSASSSAALIQIALQTPFLQKLFSNAKCDIGLVWFDGEEAVLSDWNDGEKNHPSHIVDHTYGSRFFVNQLKQSSEKKLLSLKRGNSPQDWSVAGLILLDMVGHKKLMFSDDELSDHRLKKIRDQILKDWGWDFLLSKTSKGVEDDHLPFMKVGIPSINLIDFENTLEWHNFRDIPEEISSESIKKATILAVQIARELANSP